MHYQTCPRCRERTYEKLKTHSHCASCGYSPDFEFDAQPLIPVWAKADHPRIKWLQEELKRAMGPTTKERTK